MASSDHPETPADVPAPTGIQTSVEPPAAAIPLPPPPKPPALSLEKFTRLCGWLDGSLVVLVLAFAFLVASFPATNPDFFRQLAAGRLLAQGEYHFGVDPFSYTSDGVYWVNHSWLFALMVYALYQIPVIGGAAVVVCKALMAMLLAAILLRTSRRPGQSLWIPAACTTLAILAISPRLYLQPFCLSFFFLGLTLWLLSESGQRRADSGTRRWWLIPPLFALWGNCDAWFFVGPLLIALYLLGGLLQQWFPLSEEEPDEMQPRELGHLALVLAAGLAACLLNPHHVYAFTLPAEFGLSPTNDLIQQNPQFRVMFLSPLRGIYYDPRLGLSVAGMSYWPLMFLGLISFVFLFGQLSWPRLLIWLGFALMSLYIARAIPLFAIVAGPIAARNWLDYAAYRFGKTPCLTAGWRQWSLGGRALTILLAVALLVATVPGWLQAQPHVARRLGWRVVVDPSLREAALQIKTWRDEGRLPADVHWFNMQSEVANYLVWFAPGERAFLDQGMTQFRKAAGDNLAIRTSLERTIPDENAAQEGAVDDAPTAEKKDWRSILRDRGVQFWIFDQAHLQKAERVAQRMLFANSDEWKLCYLQGRIAIFAWRDARTNDGLALAPGLELDLKRRAFGPQAKQAPPRGAESVASTSEWWDAWWVPNPPAAVDRDTAALQQARFVLLQARFLHHNSRVWQGAVAASALGLSVSSGPMPNSLLALSWSSTYDDLFPPGSLQPTRAALPREYAALRARAEYVRTQDAGPIESLYLGIRAARRALLANPHDPQTYLLLGHAYAWLDEGTQERFLKRVAPRLADIRRTQMVAAFQNCLRLKPKPMNAAEAHDALYRAFRQLGYADVAAHHLQEKLKNLKDKDAALLPGESSAQRAQTIDQLSKELTRLDDRVKRQLDQYEVNAANKPPLEKVRIALEKGLAETALNALEQSSVAGFVGGLKDLSIVGRAMGLLLDLGRLDQARDLLLPDPDLIGQPVEPQYLDFHVRLAAARGDYDDVDRLLVDALNHAWKPLAGQQRTREPRLEIGETVGRVLMSEAQPFGGAPRVPAPHPKIPSAFWARRGRADALVSGVAIEQQRADTYLLRGWIALEAGHCVEARQHFRTALATAVPESLWIAEIKKLDVLLDPKIDPRGMQVLQQLEMRESITRIWAEHYLKWLNIYQR